MFSKRLAMLVNAIKLNDYMSIDKNHEGLKEVAFINLNKRGGYSYCIWETLDEYVKQYAEYIEKEIQLISPDILDSITDKIKQTKTTFPVYIVNSSNMGYCIYENHLELVENNE